MGWEEGLLSRWPFSLTPVFLFFSIRDLLKFKEEVTKERDQLLSEVVKLRESLAQTTEQQQETERCREEAEQTISQVCFVTEGKRKENYLLEVLPILFLAQLYPLVPSTVLLVFWFVLARTVLLVHFFSTLRVWEVTKIGHFLQFWLKNVSLAKAWMPRIWRWWK